MCHSTAGFKRVHLCPVIMQEFMTKNSRKVIDQAPQSLDIDPLVLFPKLKLLVSKGVFSYLRT